MNYYPFGLKHKGYNNVTSSNGNSTAQKFGYNGVELEESLGLNLYEMDVRSYDPAIGRFTGIDPVTHYSMSPYVAFDNNPIFWEDPSGADATSYVMDLFNKSGSGYTRYERNDEGETEETARASDEDINSGKAILVSYPGADPNIKKSQKLLKIGEKIFGNGDGKIQGAGHAGIVIIDGESGSTKYFDFGRYDKTSLGNRPDDTGTVRSSQFYSSLRISDWDFNLTNDENVTKILTDLRKSPLLKKYGTIMGTLVEGLDFKAMNKYATEMEKKGYHPFGGYGSSTKTNKATYCAKFARGVIKAGGFKMGVGAFNGGRNVIKASRKTSNSIIKID